MLESLTRERAAVEAEILYLETQIHRFERGELDATVFKRLRLQYGVYSIRGSPSRYMVRVRVPLGIIEPYQLDALAALCEEFTPSSSCHLTTRQDVQLYGIERAGLPLFLRHLAVAGLATREASGNVVRNVTCCPWAGVSPEEPFAITPYAQAVSRYLLRNPLSQILPRKVKIAFEGCSTDHARTAIHDIGVVAALQNGQPGFRIYAGGGLGPAPRAGQLIEPWTRAELLLPTIEGILRIFDRYGERRNRAKARLKFLVEQLGWEAFRARVLEVRTLVWATQSGFALTALEFDQERSFNSAPSDRPTSVCRGGELNRWRSTNVAAQKQASYSSIVIRVPFGDVTAAHLRGVAGIARQHASGIRLTNEQNLLLRFVPEPRLPVVYEALRTLGLAESDAGKLADVTRCPGAESCLSAITRPRALAQALERLCHNGLSAWADAPVSIKISGCPNSCGHHPIADLGLFGMAVKVGERHVPCYQVLVGGGTREGEARFGQRLVRVPAQRAPEAVKRLMQLYAEQRQPDESFGVFVDRAGLARLQDALKDLADLTGAEHDRKLFMDLGATGSFQLDAGKGECAE